MFSREALYIEFAGGAAAVKVSAGGEFARSAFSERLANIFIGVNVISGVPASDPSPLVHGVQDYIVAGKQPWIDGIVTEQGIVRQVRRVIFSMLRQIHQALYYCSLWSRRCIRGTPLKSK
jgi:hypothetical protein